MAAGQQQQQNGPAKKEKLHGRAFYESIGSPKMIVAPMVDRSEFAWRMLTRSFMEPNSRPILAYSPMFHARLFREGDAYREQHFEALRPNPATHDSDDKVPYLDGNPVIDRPLIVQFCANDPDDLLAAARYVEPFCDAVDLNLGCPQNIAKRGRYGAFLQEDPDLIYRLINTLHTNLSIPVTAKFRIQSTKEKTLEYAKMILSAGASIITVHGRTREQKGHNTGLADWGYIRYLRDNLPPETVIFANGNILNHGDIERCLRETGADGVMSAEGNLCDPSIFAGPPMKGSALWAGEDVDRAYWVGRDGKGGYRMDFVTRRYMDIIHEYVLGKERPVRKPLYRPGDPPTPPPSTESTGTTTTAPGQQQELEAKAENNHEEGPPRKKQKRSKTKEKYTRPTSPNLMAMQGHLFQLLRPLVSVKTDVRDALARVRAGDIEAFEAVVGMVDRAVEEGIREYEACPEKFERKEVDEDGDEWTGSRKTAAEYGRPWWVCQPYIRPLPEEALEKGAMKEKKRKLAQNQSLENNSNNQEEEGKSTGSPAEAGASDSGKEKDEPEKQCCG
ncbi:hypothetical protein VTO42DRAFT_3570 [Malbranchea cinnamomea]